MPENKRHQSASRRGGAGTFSFIKVRGEFSDAIKRGGDA
jgi:hypothetical protein